MQRDRSLAVPKLLAGLSAAAIAAALTVPAAVASAKPDARRDAAPGGPGRPVSFLPADKQGFGTARGRASLVWYTLEGGTLSEVYYPNLSTPSIRQLQLVVSDGHTFTDVERSATRHEIRLVDSRSLTYEQIDTARSGDYRIIKDYVTDPARNSVLVHVRFQSLTGHPYHVYIAYQPALANDMNHDTATTDGSVLTAYDSGAASALMARPALGESSNGFFGTSDGIADLIAHHKLTHRYLTAADGDVVQTAATSLTGLGAHQELTLALGFGRHPVAARSAAEGSLAAGFADVARSYASGWHRYLARLRAVPATAAAYRTTFLVAEMVLAAGEDKTHPGAFVASPTMPWEWGSAASTEPEPSGPYHLVWARDLYEIATALLLDGDRAAASRAERYLFFVQQRPDGAFPQNSTVSGTPYFTGEQLDEYSFPTVLAWMLRDRSAATWSHVERAEDEVLTRGPVTGEERWENQRGYSPSTIAAEIAGLVCGAAIADWHGARSVASHYLATADRWQRDVDSWTVTTNGPLADHPYFLRLTKNGSPDSAVTYAIGDSGPTVDQRDVVDPSFLELVRLGVKAAHDPVIVESLAVVDKYLEVKTPEGPFWHRYSYDGYGETRTGGRWVIAGTGTPRTFGRLWPILTGERGEYEIAAGANATPYLAAMAGSANAGHLLPEQVWDGRPPTGKPGFGLGAPTTSATPLLWTEAQFIRLAWDMQAGRLLDQPSVVACRYVKSC